MSEPNSSGLATPDPHRIVTRREFGSELTLARERRGLSVRQVARQVEVPASTLGGYFAGTHLPALQPPDLLGRILRVLGIEDDGETAAWWEAYWRVRRSAAAERSEGGPGTAAQVTVSTWAPVDRLLVEPTLRGRDGLVQRLDDAIARTNQLHPAPRVHVVHGLGGCGKSMVALAVANRAVARGVATFWIAADDRSTMVAGMRALAARIGVPVDWLHGGSLPDAIWQQLHGLNEPWLLVLDNADDPPEYLALPGHRLTDGTGWLRAVGPAVGTVIVTTRDGDRSTWGDPPPAWLALHRLSGLRRDDGAQILVELAGEHAGDPAEAGDLSDRLGGLPLALMLTGRYLAESRRMPAGLSETAVPRSYRAYLEALQRGDYAELFAVDITGRPPRRDARMTIGQNWRLSLDLLTERGLQYARPLLNVLACLGATPIPYGDLLRPDVLARSTLFPGITARSIWEVLRALESLGLIALISADKPGVADDDPPGLLDIHPLARDTARSDPHIRERIADYLATVTALLGGAVRDAHPKSPAAWRQWRLLAGHCTAPLDLLDLLDNQTLEISIVHTAVELAASAGQYLRAAGLHEPAESAFVRALQGCDGRLPANDSARLAIEHDLARLRYDQGLYEEAERLYRCALSARRSSLGAEHTDTLTTQYYLARTLRHREQLDEADSLLQLTYGARLRLLGERHPDTLTSRHGIADLLRARGEVAEAVSLYQEVLSARRVVLGEQHPATLVTRQYRAEMLHVLDRTDEAEDELRRLWAATQQVRGLDHPRTLAIGHSLVDLLHDRGRLEDAASLADTVLAARRRLFGNTHPTTMNIRHRLALIRLDLGEVAVARRDLIAVLVDRGLVLGRNHPQTQLSQHTVDAVQRRIVMSQSAPPDAGTLAPDRPEAT